MSDDAPFDAIPSGVDLARYFWHETERRNPGCDGIDLWRDGADYCYLWVKAMVDLDMWNAYLLDVRTSIDGKETRDYLFLFAGAEDRFDVSWHNQPISFGAPSDKVWARFEAGMKWLAKLTEKSVEDANDVTNKEKP